MAEVLDPRKVAAEALARAEAQKNPKPSTPTGTTKVPVVGNDNQLPAMETEPTTEWSKFIDGTLVLNSVSTTC